VQLRRALSASTTALVVAAATLWSASGVPTPSKYKVLHAFGSGKDGAGVWDSLVFGKNGSLYGTTSGGGTYGYGTVFKLTPQANGTWSESVLHSFDFHKEGATPTGGLIFDGGGNLYGTAPYGGSHDGGSVFELTLGHAGWTESVLYDFGSHSNDAYAPYAGLTADKIGDLYGTGHSVFELLHSSSGWSEKVIHRFTRRHDGDGPIAAVTLDAVGDIYGTTEAGGTNSFGTVYRVRHTSSGWEEQVLHSFPAFQGDGRTPGVGALIVDASGSLYGTTAGGGCCGGVVFKLVPGTDGRWKETILYEFQGGATGFEPGSGVVMDQAGNLYGTTISGGTCCGVIYELSPVAMGKWKYKVLHSFTGNDGAQPDANLILDKKGNLYGTTATGGASGGGVAFELTP
jgi:uncharacterized repeat protein (TIGR03803 family)